MPARSYRLKWRDVLAIGAALITIIALLHEMGWLRRSPRFALLQPREGSTVVMDDVVRASTPYADKKHYVIVTPVTTRAHYVQKGPLLRDDEGNLTGSAKYGDVDAGNGETFILQIAATERDLPEGIVDSLDGVELSSAVTVVRHDQDARSSQNHVDARIVNSALPRGGTLRINRPAAESAVEPLQDVDGTASAGAVVWIIVHPVETNDYWVQPSSVVSRGVWQARAHFGEPGHGHSHKRYELLAIVDPAIPLSSSQRLSNWPDAAIRSEVVRVVRR